MNGDTFTLSQPVCLSFLLLAFFHSVRLNGGCRSGNLCLVPGLWESIPAPLSAVVLVDFFY